MMGEARVTAIREGSLSSVTVRGAEITLAVAFSFRNENTALTPSASRKAVAGLKPCAVSNISLGQSVESGRFALVPAVTGADCKLLPKARFCFCKVPVQSNPLAVFGFNEV